MPFGLCNSGATFQRLMDVVMYGLQFQICLIYLDDIIIFSTTVEQHLEIPIIDSWNRARHVPFHSQIAHEAPVLLYGMSKFLLNQ